MYPTCDISRYLGDNIHIQKIIKFRLILFFRCSRFSREERLQQLVIELVEAISNRNGCGYLSSDSLIEKKQLKKVFDLLPPSSQKMILLSVAGKCILWICDISVLVHVTTMVLNFP